MASRERGVPLSPVADFTSVTGKGVTGVIEGRPVVIGNLRHLEALGITSPALLERADELRRQGQTVMLIAVDGKPAGASRKADPGRPGTSDTGGERGVDKVADRHVHRNVDVVARGRPLPAMFERWCADITRRGAAVLLFSAHDRGYVWGDRLAPVSGASGNRVRCG